MWLNERSAIWSKKIIDDEGDANDFYPQQNDNKNLISDCDRGELEVT